MKEMSPITMLRTMTVVSPGACQAEGKPVGSATVFTRTDAVEYTDSYYACHVDTRFADGIDPVLDYLDAMAH
jgi:hypothetical protein